MTNDYMRSFLYVITWDNSATMRAIMALALAHYEDLFKLVSGYQ